ncbi:hypothetical protein CC85DRAFT_22501 [Cutaneotrichosporon oleaginosum]|uniref:Uncharacterized protein n=1 Tax=Cutaneotrichosporon oleaginosum TaxID=879819 RepID=A0A0J0XST6_9TREE|nr:uncharacterized protein CC85DRAFT_22501 [Cutaneotrichosporon oleaginosum]KLT44171.1 hypothetical protein CC85DRAFT_22501 [Cutaneotrichosporon oleaginosum]TXT11658.1 hypothetical protein COLE_02068 [Cutaneotrichosporon oleaginosum]
MDSRVLLGLTSNRAQQQAPPPLPPSQLHYLPSPFGYLRTGTPSPMPFTPWPRCRPYPIQQHVQQHQTPTPLASFPPEEAPLIDAMLPSNASRNRGGDPSYPQQQTPPSALASFLPTDLSNVVSPIDPTSSPFDVFETMHSNAPQASEQRAVSADPPRWDTSAEQHDWARPVSAPPSKLAATPPYEAAQSRIPISTGEPTGPGHQDLFAGYGDAALMGSGTFASQQQPAKPPVESSFGTALRPIYDFDFKWSPFPDAPEWDMSAAATQQHPAPYTYGYSPPAQAEPAGSMLPTLGPSGSSPFPSFQDTRTPHDSPRDETLAAPTYGAHPNI